MGRNISMIRGIISLVLFVVSHSVESTSIGGDIVVDTNLTLNGTPYVVTQDLVVAENATLTIQPGVQLHFGVGVALKVKGSLEAKGNPGNRIVFTRIPTNSSVNNSANSLVNGFPVYRPGIRLRNGSSYKVGRLEVFLNGQWGTVCDDWWGTNDAEVNQIYVKLVIQFSSPNVN